MASHPSTYTGLTAAQVTERVQRGESNAFKARVGRSYWEIVRDNILNIFNIVFFLLMIVVFALQDYSTAIFAGFSVVTNSVLGMFQEISAKRKLDQLAALAAKDILVWRDGKLVGIPIHDIVKDDIIPIEPGDRLVVDGKILESDSLEMDESQLTGESDAVFKEMDSEVHSGSFCIAGTGVMVVTRVGKNSTINNLSTIAKVYKNILTPTQKRLAAVVQVALIIMLIVLPMLGIAGYLADLTTLEIVRSLVVFVSSIVPQGLVLTAILSLTIGAISISRFQTLIQRVNAVESMANVTVLCFDKTGTLTRNILTVSEIIPLGGRTLPQLQDNLRLYTGSLSYKNRTAAAIADVLPIVSSNGSTPTKLHEIPFNSSRKWGAVGFANETFILGAPERIIDAKTNATTAIQAKTLAEQGLRVLAFARSAQPLVDGQLGEDTEALALIVLTDQIRPDIQETLDAFKAQNVALKVISGDNLETVSSIASASGMQIRKAYTGDQLQKMNDAELRGAVVNADLFARIEPETKRRIIAALKQEGQYVAMVGDGVNDVPALKEAHLAIAMNDGAQIAKDVAEIVLLNNAMSTLPKAFLEGKEITQTIFSSIKLFLAKNFYTIVLIFFVGFMALPFPTSPAQISWVTLGTVNIPATLIAFKILRPKHMAKFRRDVLEYVIISGMISAVVMALMYVVAYYGSDENVDIARSAITLFITLFGTLIFWNVSGIEMFEPRTLREHWRIVLLGIVLTALTMVVPFIVPSFFAFIPPPPLIWALVISTFLLTATLLHVFTRDRRIIEQLWELFQP
ncbi:MAG: HAD-IC family P-type ATPase [Anaerolineaceae bacterium]|nr:HAD-IC family P-type ATPase [Anaerolineaceae bacterium]